MGWKSSAELSSLLQKLYAAPMEPALWPEVLQSICGFCGLGGAAFLFQDLVQKECNVHLTVGIDPAASRPYEDYYSSIDEWWPPFLKTAEGKLSLSEDLCSNERLHRSEFYNDFVVPYDLPLFCAIPTLKRSNAVEFVTFYRRKSGRPSSDPDSLKALSLLLPHLRIALRLRQHLTAAAEQERQLHSALNMLRFGIVLLDSAGCLLFANEIAEQILKNGDGLSMHQNKLNAQRSQESARLYKLIKSCALLQSDGGPPGGAMLVSRRRGGSLQVMISPFTGEQSSARIAVLISIAKHGPIGTAQVLRALYALTSTESSIAELLLCGLSLNEVADLNRISRETVRSHVKAILRKTQTRGQSDFIRLCSNLPQVQRFLASPRP